MLSSHSLKGQRTRSRKASTIVGTLQLSICQIAEAIGGMIKQRPNFVRQENASVVRLCPDLAKLRGLINVDSFKSFEEGIRRTVGEG